jgi:hypothetical protein
MPFAHLNESSLILKEQRFCVLDCGLLGYDPVESLAASIVRVEMSSGCMGYNRKDRNLKFHRHEKPQIPSFT